MSGIALDDALCLVAAGLVIGVTLICVLFAKITSSQKGAIGCSVLAGIFCCLLAGLLLCVALL